MVQNEFFNLAVVFNNSMAQLTRRLRKEAGKQPFSLSEQTTMALLEQNKKMLPSELAESHHISAQAMSQILNRLFEQRCIIKSEDEKDGRKVYVSLNANGKSRLAEMRAARSQWLSLAIEKALSKEDAAQLSTFVALLQKLSMAEF
ncbi:MAG TPA: MarR family transcriptional regulator [Arachidicoccus sp.]